MVTITIPTYLTLLRMMLVMPLVFFISLNAWKEAALVLLIAAATDVLDGWIARTFHQVSSLGALLDPLSDKILILGCYYACSLNPQQSCSLPTWFVVLLIGREVFLMSGALIITQWYKIIAIQPLISGKLANFVQIVFVLHVIIANFFAWPWNYCMYGEMMLVVGLSFFSLGSYIIQAYRGLAAWRLKRSSFGE